MVSGIAGAADGCGAVRRRRGGHRHGRADAGAAELGGTQRNPRATAGGEDGVAAAVVLAVQVVDEPLASPPPSNNAPDDAVVPVVVQPVMACPGSTGEMPGVAISVDPSGMPTGRVDCGLR